jgi:hypothetical protein
MKAILREPLFHFFAIGVAIFALFAAFDDTPPPRSENVITVTEDDARRLAAGFEATWRRPPSQPEFEQLLDEFVREEVYVREALLLGLDREDPVIRRRLQLKMEFLTEAGAQAVAPDDATLEEHLASHADRFRRAPRVAFEQIILDDAVGGAAIPAIRTSLNNGEDPGEIGQSSLLPSVFPAGPPQVVDGTFGTGFFEAIRNLPVREWAGPVESSFGRHMVRLVEWRDGDLPPLEAIRDQVLEDWRATVAAELREKRFEAMRGGYEVYLPDISEVLDR